MSKRDHYFDNAKFFLMFLVFFGHMIQPFTGENREISSIYKVIYSFHMPAFIIISGYFAKNFKKRGYFKKLIKKLILPYIIFQIIFSVFYYFLRNEQELDLGLSVPHWSLWYLISLFFWNVLLIPFSKLNWMKGIGLSIALSLIAGYVNEIDAFLSLSRTIVFFPLFLIGFHLNRGHFSLIRKKQFRFPAIMIFFSIFCYFYFNPGFDSEWFYGRNPYEILGADLSLAPFMRAGMYLLNLAAAASFFSFISEKESFITKYGRNTLYVYLLHGFIIQPLRESTMIEKLDMDLYLFVFLALFTFVCTLILAGKVVTTIAEPVIELKTTRWRELIHRFKKKKANKYDFSEKDKLAQ